jgi:dCTP deaminase
MWHCHDYSFIPQEWNQSAINHKNNACLLPQMITPYNAGQVNAASYDVCIGDKIKLAIDGNPDKWNEIDISTGIVYSLVQGEFILTETIESFHIPRNVSAQFALKSSRGREGYEHLSAGFIDPAWHGSKLTMELFNANPNPIPIYKGLRIGQIIFSRCDATPIKGYDKRGRYNNDNGVRESKG